MIRRAPRSSAGRSILAIALALVVAMPVGAASAQDDWGLTRDRSPATQRDRGARPPRSGARGGARPGGGQRAPRATPREEPVARAAAPDRTALMIERYLGVLEREPADGFALDRLVELYRERDGSDRALRTRLEERAREVGGWWATTVLGHLARRGRRLDEARALYEAAVGQQPEHPLPRAALARVLRDSGELDAAEAALQAALERSRGPARDELLRELASLALDRGDLDEARRRFDRLAGGPGASVYLRTELARALVQRGDHERAIAELERVAASLRGDARAAAPVLVELARAQLAAGRDADAVATLERVASRVGASSGMRAEVDELRLDAYRRAGRLEDLAEALARRRDADSAALLGRIHDELGNDHEALAAYRRALRSRRDLDLRIRIAQVLARAGRVDELIEEHRALARLAPDEPRHVVQLAELLAQTGRRDEALAVLAQASRRSREPVLHQRLAELYARWGEQERAEAELATLTRLDPRDPLHVVALGSQQFERGDREGALATWRRILQLGADPADAYATLGGILADHDLLADAVEAYREAERRAGDRIEIVRGLATVLERAGRDAEALPRWEQVLRLAADDRAARREARERIVGIWARTRVLDQQASRLSRAFRESQDVDAGRMLAEVYRRRRDLAGAERVLARLAALEPSDVETLTALERVRTQAGDRAGAIEALRLLVEAEPRRAAAHLLRMAEHALALYRDEEARAYAREAVERSPDDANAHRRLGDLLRAGQDIEGAIASYERALERDPRLFDTAFDLAEMHLARGDHAAADRIYRDVLVRAPDDDLVARAARASVQIHVGAGTLEALERDLLPLALARPERPIYRRVVVEVYDAITGPLVVRARREGPAGEEARAALRRWGTRAIKPLLEALADRDPSQRRIALAILGPLGNPAAAGPLLAVAEGSESVDVRLAALQAVAAIAPASLVPRLAALSTAEPPALRAAATLALARIGGRAAVEALRPRLSDRDATVRGWAALGLGLARDGASAATLRRVLDDPRDHARACASLALGWMRDAAAVPVLVALSREGAAGVSPAALAALAGFDDPVARAALARALFVPDAVVRDAAAVALRRGAPSVRELPMPAPGEGPAELATRLARGEPGAALPAIDLAPIAPALVAAVREVLTSGTPSAIEAALSTLAAGPGPLGLGPLTADVEGWPGPQRAAALSVLAEMRGEIEPDVLRASRSEDSGVRAEAVRLVAGVGSAAGVEVLARALADDAAVVRRAALDALATLSSPAPALREAVEGILRSGDDWAMRTRAARALGAFGGHEAVAALAAALRDDEFAFVREAAAEALGRLGASEALSVLVEACGHDAEPAVRVAAARALGALGGQCDPTVPGRNGIR